MTIAAGFRCLDGVLVGADSRLESGDIKYEEDKTFIIPSGRSDFLVVVTGSGDFEAVQHCVYLLDGNFFKNCDGSLAAIAGEIRRFSDSKAYRKLVDSLQPHLKPDLLFGIRSVQGETELLHLFDNKFHQVREYIAIGAGHSTAMLFSKWLYRPDFDIEGFAPLAVQIFRAAKGTHVGCEGNTTLHRLFNGGATLSAASPLPPGGDEKLLWGLYDALPALLLCCADDRPSEAYFEECLEKFSGMAREIRKAMTKAKAAHRAMTIAAQPSPELTTHDPQSPPASQE